MKKKEFNFGCASFIKEESVIEEELAEEENYGSVLSKLGKCSKKRLCEKMEVITINNNPPQ